MISVIILTKNEEDDLPSCLMSLNWCDDIHVLDSGSTDRTIDVAKEYGAKVSTNRFDGFGTQRNFALDHLDIKYNWILFLDADEHSTEKFRQEIFDATDTAGWDVAGFYCCSKLMLEGKWLRRSDTFPKWQFRLLKKGRAKFINLGHGQKECAIDGAVKYIKEGYLHFGISKGWYKWIERHNHYSTLEAEMRVSNSPPFQSIFVRHASIRNVALKCWVSRFTAWPFLRFFHAYVLNLGFLEGTPGFMYCINNFYYEFMIMLKYRELKLSKKTRNQSNAYPQTININDPARTTYSDPNCTPGSFAKKAAQ